MGLLDRLRGHTPKRHLDDVSGAGPGDYVHAGAGVCREHAMLTHLALREAGVETRYLYVRVVNPDGTDYEDHAVALAFDNAAWDAYGDEHDIKKAWIVDAYNEMFDGRRMESFLGRGGTRGDETRPGVSLRAMPKHWFGYSMRVLDYPTYWVPVRAALPAYTKDLAGIDVTKLDYGNVRVVHFDAEQTRRWPPSWLRFGG